MNLSELSARVMARIGRDDLSGSVPAWLNLGLQRIARRHVFRETRTRSTVAVTGVLGYALPASRMLASVRYSSGEVEVVPLRVISYQEFDETYPEAEINPQYGTPEVAVVYGTDLWVYPIPQTGNLYLRYAVYPTQFTSVETSTTNLPYDELIIAAATLVGGEELQMHPTLMSAFEKAFEIRMSEAVIADNDYNRAYNPKPKGFTIEGDHTDGTGVI